MIKKREEREGGERGDGRFALRKREAKKGKREEREEGETKC